MMRILTPALVATVLAFFFIEAIAKLTNEKVGESLRQERKTIERLARENSSGFPASGSQIVHGHFYLCHASIWQASQAGTNYFAVLMEVTPGTNNIWQVAGTNRFFELPFMLTRGATYLAGKGQSNVVFQLINGKAEN